MTPDWTFQVLWFSAGIGGTGAVWYFLSQREYHTALWVGFATVVIVFFTIILHVRNELLKRQPAVSAPVSQRQETPSGALQFQLARGWTIHKRDDSWAIYFMVDTSRAEDYLRPELQRGDVPLELIAPHLLDGVRELWADVSARFPRPEPPRTPIGPVSADLVEHINHTFDAPSGEPGLNWNYEYVRSGTSIKQIAPSRAPMSQLSTRTQATVTQLDQLARDTVNRWYVEAIQRATKKP